MLRIVLNIRSRIRSSAKPLTPPPSTSPLSVRASKSSREWMSHVPSDNMRHGSGVGVDDCDVPGVDILLSPLCEEYCEP